MVNPRRLYNFFLVMGITIILFVLGSFVFDLYSDVRMKKNDALAKERSELLFKAIETYARNHDGTFPRTEHDFDGPLGFPFCGDIKDGYIYTCEFGYQYFIITVYPVEKDKTGQHVINKEGSLVLP